jgi:hypothetical protein
MSVRLKVLLICVLGVATPACAADAPARATGIAPPTRIPDALLEAPTPAGEPVATAAVPRDVRRAVAADAANRFKVAESSVVLTGAEQVMWSDGSLGCPEPGILYTQMLVPGFRVTAKTQEGQLIYHTDSRGNARTCGTSASGPAKRLADKVPQGNEPHTAPPTPAPPQR